MAYGGGNWILKVLDYGKGLNEQGIELFQTGDGTSSRS